MNQDPFTILSVCLFGVSFREVSISRNRHQDDSGVVPELIKNKEDRKEDRTNEKEDKKDENTLKKEKISQSFKEKPIL